MNMTAFSAGGAYHSEEGTKQIQPRPMLMKKPLNNRPLDCLLYRVEAFLYSIELVANLVVSFILWHCRD